MAYTTVEACKLELGITADTDDALLAGYVAIAQRTIEAPPPVGTGRVFEASTNTTRYLDAPAYASGDPDGPSYVLDLTDYGDLCSINSITNGDGTTVTSSQYVTIPRYKTPYNAIRLLRFGSVIWTYSTNPEGAIAISGKWAYSATVPDDIARCATRLVAWLYSSRDNAGADQVVQTDQGIILPNQMPKDIQAILNGYRSLVV